MLADTHFFSLFDLPISFWVDKSALKNKLLSLQKSYHPDNADINLQPQAEHDSSLINHAFNTLNGDDTRAFYLLDLAGQAIDNNASISDFEFLGQMMMVRVALDEAKDSQDAPALNQLQTDTRALMATFGKVFAHAYDTKDWTGATLAAQQLKFLTKLLDDIDAAVTHIAHSDNDDDLYT